MNPAVQVVSGQQPPEITQQNQASLLSPQWTIYADENGMQLKTGGVSDTLVQWKDLIITNGMNNPMVDFGTPSESSSDVTLDNEAVYRYKGDKSGFVLDFKVTDEISKQSLIESLNGKSISKKFSANVDVINLEENGMKVKIRTDQIKFEMQNTLGRDFSQDTNLNVTSDWDGTYLKLNIESTRLDGTKNSVTYEYELDEEEIRDAIQKGGIIACYMAITDSDKTRLNQQMSAQEEKEGLKSVKEMFRMSLNFKDILAAANGDIQAAFDNAKNVLSSINTQTVAHKATITDWSLSNQKSVMSKETVLDMKVDPPMKKLNLQAGPDEDKTIELKWKPLSLGMLGMSGLSVESEDLAKVSLATIGRVIDEISEQRASFGAQQNRLEYTVDNENNIVENLTASESRIRDADLEKEMVIYAKHSILEQAGQSLVAQANQSKQGIASRL